MKIFSRTTVLLMMATALIVGLAVYGYEEKKQESFVGSVTAEITRHTEALSVQADLVKQVRGDDAVNAVIKDCGVRAQYETLLSRLNQLTDSELAEVEQLFYRCADYYPNLKSIMTLRMQETFLQYKAMTALLGTVRPTEAEEYPVAAWESLVLKESTRAQLLQRQRDLQEGIIVSLRARNSAALPALLEEAQNVADSLNVLDIQINTDRANTQIK